MKRNPIGEVYGFPTDNLSKKALRGIKNKFCPFGNIVPNCTKDKANDPLGVCSVIHNDDLVITCPIRFREDWVIIENAAKFAFGTACNWTSLSEIKLIDDEGLTAGNIDYVVVKYNESGKILDFASIEVQGVYISGNLRNPFNNFIEHPSVDFEWTEKNYPHPDYLSSSRKRLIPQMLSKGGILKTWGKKQCIVIQKSFFATLPDMPTVKLEEAEIAWFLYDLVRGEDNLYHLTLSDTVYTKFNSALHEIIKPKKANINKFTALLQEKLDDKMSTAPDNPGTILDVQ